MQHPPTQGIPTSSSNSELEAMKSAHDDAVNTNERIFPIFAKKLASKDAMEYINTMRKLTVWLSSEKAYYKVARPKIVQLLEIALSTFVEALMQPADVVEFAEPLRLLVGTILPFVRLFTETELRSKLHRVIVDAQLALNRVPANAAHGNPPLQEPPNPIIPPHPPLVSVASPRNVPLQLKMPLTPIAQPSVLHVQLPSVPASAVEAVFDTFPHNDTLPARHPPEIASANPPLSFPIATTSRQPVENGHLSPSIPSKPQPRRARRAELSEELIARDLDWFKSNHTPGVGNPQGPSASASQGVGEPLSGLATDTAQIPPLLTSPKRKTARMVPSRRLPRRISLEAGENAESNISEFGLPPVPQPPAGENIEESWVQNADEQKPSQERTEPVRSASESGGMQEVPSYEPPPSEPQPIASTSSEPAVKPEIHQMDLQSLLVKTTVLNGDITMSPVALFDITPDRMESMDISVAGSERMLSEPPPKTGSTPPPSPLMLRLPGPILPPLVGSWEPPLNLNFSVSQISSGQVQESAVDANQERFDGKMTVIHCMQGKPFTHTHVIDINPTENMFAMIAKWVNRRSHPSEAPQGVCISLACYRLPELFSTIKSESGRHDIQVLTSRSSCSWPHGNRLSLRVDEGTKQTVITLAPPFFLTPDQCVDISSLMKPGKRTLELRQLGDMSEYLVVLHAHHPTRAQLAALQAVKVADERWRRFLEAVSARVVPERTMLSTTGVVGVV